MYYKVRFYERNSMCFKFTNWRRVPDAVMRKKALQSEWAASSHLVLMDFFALIRFFVSETIEAF